MAIKQAVTTVFKGDDKSQNRAFNRMGKNADKFGERGSRAFRKLNKSATKTSTIMKGILAAGAVQKAFGLLGQGISSVTTQFIEFDDAIVGASARFKDIGADSENYAKQLIKIKGAAREAGSTTEYTAAQSAKALDFLARAGFSSAEAIGSLKSMINLATASGEDFASVADMSSDLLGAFGLSVNDPIQKIKNLNRLNDVLVKTTNSANVTVENMFETMKQIGPIATGVMGASLEEVSALTAIMGNSGLKGSDAMTALKNAYLRMAAPAGKAADVMEELGLTVTDKKTGKFKTMTTLMEEFGNKIKGLSVEKQAKALDAILGKRAIAGGKVLIDNISNIRKFKDELKKAGGTSEKTAKLMRGSMGNVLKSLGSAASEFGFKFFDAFDDKAKGGLLKLTEAIRNINVKPIINAIQKLFSAAKNIFDKFVEIGKRTGLFDNIQKSAEKLRPVFWVIKDIIKSIWGFLERTGIIDLVARSFSFFAKSIGLTMDAFVIMWKVVKPILKAIEPLIKPIVKLINMLLTGLEKVIDLFSSQLNKPGQFALQNITTSGFRQQERGERAPAATREEELSRVAANAATQAKPARPVARQQVSGPQGRLAATLNIKGAPEGSTVEQDSDLMRISLSEMAPAPPALSPRMG